jgi:peptide deformylase
MSDIYDIILHPDPVLKQIANPIGSIDGDIKAQADKMIESMYAARGIGLAANQVNILNRMFVMDVDPDSWTYKDKNATVLKVDSVHREAETDEHQPNPMVMINPEIVKASDQTSVCLEGCLSLPQQFADVERPAHITVSYIDLSGNRQEMEASGLVSHCVQHELDHLDGVLFIDYLSRLKKNTLVRKLEKYKKSEGLL